MSYYLQLTLLAPVPEAGLPDGVAHTPIRRSPVGLLGPTQHADPSLFSAVLRTIAISMITATA
jgi:hypothetical protein